MHLVVLRPMLDMMPNSRRRLLDRRPGRRRPRSRNPKNQTDRGTRPSVRFVNLPEKSAAYCCWKLTLDPRPRCRKISPPPLGWSSRVRGRRRRRYEPDQRSAQVLTSAVASAAPRTKRPPWSRRPPSRASVYWDDQQLRGAGQLAVSAVRRRQVSPAFEVQCGPPAAARAPRSYSLRFLAVSGK